MLGRQTAVSSPCHPQAALWRSGTATGAGTGTPADASPAVRRPPRHRHRTDHALPGAGGITGGPRLMRHAPAMRRVARHPHAAGPWCTPGAGRRWDTVPGGRRPAGRTRSAHRDGPAGRRAAGPTAPGRPAGRRRAGPGRGPTTARPASPAAAPAGGRAAESPRWAGASAAGGQTPRPLAEGSHETAR